MGFLNKSREADSCNVRNKNGIFKRNCSMTKSNRQLSFRIGIVASFFLSLNFGFAVAIPADATDDWIGEVVELADKRCDQPPNPNLPGLSPSFYEPKGMTEAQKVAFILKGIQTEKTARRRLCCLKILVERFPLTTDKKIESIATNGSLDLDIRRRAIWIAGIMRNEKSITWLEKLLGSMEPTVRESAIDALGFILFPYYLDKFWAPTYFDPMGVHIGGDIPIHVSSAFKFGVLKRSTFAGMDDQKASKMLVGVHPGKKVLKKLGDEATRKRIVKRLTDIMLKGRSQEERIAAARALAGYKPDEYKMRVAEWGVWVESEGQLQLAKTVLDEIPPIAYQTTKQIAELKKRVNQIMIVTKPIIHVTVDRPLSIDVQAHIRKGQPWFTYPRPSCFEIDVFGTPREKDYTDTDFQKTKNVADATSKKWQPFGEQAHQGYPFLFPKARKVGGYSGRFGGINALQSIGVRWQHLLVSPKQLDWMVEPQVAEEYSWWTDLRKVDSSWVSNGFESEKFLYYDGPTLLRSPIQIETKGKGANRSWEFRYFGLLRKVPAGENTLNEEKPIGLWVEVKDGKVRGRKIDFDYDLNDKKRLEAAKKRRNLSDLNMMKANHSFQDELDLNGEALKLELYSMIEKHNGLTTDEAKGLVDAWDKQFFKTEGKRLILRIRRHDYDYQCPLKISPSPTETARVGLVLSEFGSE